MIEIYRTENNGVYEKTAKIIGVPESSILKTGNGKPYVEGNRVFFSLSHTSAYAVIAVSDRPIGIDAEVLREKKYTSVLKRFSGRERAQIVSFYEFLENWVVKEAYIKLRGYTLASHLKRLEYYGGVLYADGQRTDCNILIFSDGELIYAVCADSEIKENLYIKRI